MSVPTTTPAWVVSAVHKDSFSSLVLSESVPVPKLGALDVLVQVEAVSLNYRDLAIPRVSTQLSCLFDRNYDTLHANKTNGVRAFTPLL